MELVFKECATCAAKPGAAVLCPGCLNNRTVIERLKAFNIHMIPVTESLPDYEVEVLSTNGKYWNVVERIGTKKSGEIWKLCENGKDDTKEEDRLDVEVTYWTRLPDAKRYAK